MWRHSIALAVLAGIDLIVCSDTSQAGISLPSRNLTISDGTVESAQVDDGLATGPIAVSTNESGLPLAPRLEEPEFFKEQEKMQVILQWKRPQQTYGVLRGYRVMYGKRGSPKHQFLAKELLPGDDFIIIKDLGGGMSYEFRIAAFNSLGVGVEAVKEVQIPEGVPTGPPQNISYSFNSPSAIRIAWEPPAPDMQNGQITGYTLHFEVNGTTVKTNVTQPYLDFDKTELREEYTYRISAWTKQGEGQASQRYMVITTPEPDIVPPAPDLVSAAAINNTHAEVRWSPIPSTRDMWIRGYKVSFRCAEEINLNNLCTHAGSVYVKQERFFLPLVILPNLETGRNYSVTVAGKTRQSVGQPSKPAVFRMAPEQVPWDIHVTNIAKDSITLRWKPPLLAIPVRYYVAWCGRKAFLDENGRMQIDEIPSRANTTTTTKTTLHYLEPYTTYSIRLTAVLQGGYDTPTVRLEVKTAADAPPKLLPPTLTTVTANGTIRVQLNRPTEKYGPIKHYLVVVVPSQLANKHPDNYSLAELTRHELSSGQQTGKFNGFPYIAANFSPENLPPTFDLGDGNVCGLYKNRALMPGQHYKVFVRAYVDSPKNLKPLYTSSPFSEDVSTDRQAGITEAT